MKNVILFSLLVILSSWTKAEPHKQSGALEHKLFERFDTDRDGTVSSAEHEAAITEMSNERRQRFAEMDANGDGAVSKDEARATAKARRDEWQQKNQQKYNKLFEKIDRDGDGAISRDEFRAIAKMRQLKQRLKNLF